MIKHLKQQQEFNISKNQKNHLIFLMIYNEFILLVQFKHYSLLFISF
jgi:hypothetical protein